MTVHNGEPGARRAAAVFEDLQAGFKHHQEGRVERAETLYRKVLRRAPDNIDALRLLGIIAYERGRHDYAVQLISRALASRPDFAEAHLNLGCALQALGRLEEAEAAFRRAVAVKSDYAVAHSNLSFLLNLRQAFEAALVSAERAAELMPELAEAHLNCGIALAGQHRPLKAEAAFRRSLGIWPDRAETLSELGQTLIDLKRFDEALACHRRAAALQPANPTIHYRLSAAQVMMGDAQESEVSCRHALSLNTNYAPGWSTLGQLLRTLGRFEEARSCFSRALELDPELPEAFAGLAVIGHRDADEAQLRRLHNLMTNRERPPGVRVDAGFALGMLLDNADRYDEAFAAFAEANALRREQLAEQGQVFDPGSLRREVDYLMAACTPALYAMVEGEANPSEAPVFVVGMPRSGTSLVEQIAATHSRVAGVGERREIGSIVDAVRAHGWGRSAEQLDPDLARRLADDYVARLQSLGLAAHRVIDKMPDNILFLGLIAVLFPKARVVFCRRDIRDICLSCYFRLFDEGLPYAQDLADCAARALEIERLAEHWRNVLPLRMATIDYEALVADLEGESRRLIEFLGLDWEPACLEFHKTERPVLTASGWQVRQPIYDRSVGRWRRYERHLAPLFGVLAQSRSGQIEVPHKVLSQRTAV